MRPAASSDVADVARRAHAVGAEVFLDAVHYAPHGPLDVQALDCDYMVCSGYKIFAPHMGFACCRREVINRLPTFREDFIPDVTPDKLEAGTFVYENVAGMDAAIGYIESLGRGFANPTPQDAARSRVEAIGAGHGRDCQLRADAVRRAPRRGRRRPGLTVFGVHRSQPPRQAGADACASTSPASTRWRSRTASGARDIGLRAGHMYSPRLISRLGRLPNGVVRASLVHYNTIGEVARFGTALREVLRELR
jgi:selenocysteine lyase/cysteine desulfurase